VRRRFIFADSLDGNVLFTMNVPFTMRRNLRGLSANSLNPQVPLYLYRLVMAVGDVVITLQFRRRA
jgi:hypothetical protein